MPNLSQRTIQWAAGEFILALAGLPYKFWLGVLHLAERFGFPAANLFWQHDRCLFGKTSAQSLIKRFNPNSNDFTPFGHGLSHAIDSNEPILACIASLLFDRRPSAILRRIALRIVDSVKRVFVARSAPHVLKKRLIGGSPAVANRDSLGSIPSISGVFRIVTPRNGVTPRRVFRSSCVNFPSSMARVSVLSRSFAASYAHLASITATALHFAIGKLMRRNINLFPAQTLAMPDNLLSPAQIRRANSGKSSKYLVREIMLCAHLAIMPHQM